MNEHESHRFGVWAMISSCAAVAVACISATYGFTYNSFKDQLEQYKQSSEWQLPKLLHDLGGISGTLNQQLAQKTEWDRLRAFEAQHTQEFFATKDALQNALQRLAAVEGETVSLETLQTVPLGEPGLLVGLDFISILGDMASLHVGEKSISLGIGASAVYESATQKYTIAFKGRRSGSRSYDFVLTRKPKP